MELLEVKSILFVCLGNICRSPIADGIAKELIKIHSFDILIDSAGTGNYHIGEAPCERSQIVALKNGVDISTLRARQINSRDKEIFDLVIAMDSSNYTNLKRVGFKNLFKLGDFGFDGLDVPDPYFFDGIDGFDKVFDMIDVGVKNIFNEILKGKR
ncbi:MAG: low molecular weight phosphotyrosine protein phosphatase [Campylobacterales bacterium]|nr:low molecular weight phosphotyrosine protein phosphatase [Campylobacterales bacterium]